MCVILSCENVGERESREISALVWVNLLPEVTSYGDTK